MSVIKRRRLENPTILQPTNSPLVQGNSFLQQQIVLGPVVDHEKQNILNNSQMQVMSNSNIIVTNPNGQSNTFVVVQQDDTNANGTQTFLQSIPMYLLVPQSKKKRSSIYKVACEENNDKVATNVDKNSETIVIKDVRTIKNEEEEMEMYPETSYLDEEDPLRPDTDRTVKHVNDNAPRRTMYKCDFDNCPLSFMYPFDRQKHRDTHMFPVSTEFRCSICNMIFDNAVTRNKHVESHSVAYTHTCVLCKISFPYYTTLIHHMDNDCRYVASVIKCPVCSMPFASRKQLIQHHEEMHNETKFDGLAVKRKNVFTIQTQSQNTAVSPTDVIVLD